MNRVENNNIVAYHPGYYVKEMIEDLAITYEEVAKRLDMSPKQLNDFVDEKSNLSEEMAIKLSKAFGTSVELWVNLDKSFIWKSIVIEKFKMDE